ncbi:MAG: hypothetical protein M1830_006654, partial [Pleopsidium flavum]
MAIFPSSSDYFSKDTDSRSSSTVTTPWTWTTPRTMPSVEVLPLMDKVLTDAPATRHYTHLPFDVRERRQSASSDEDSVVAWRNPRGPSGDVEWRHYARAERESMNTSCKSTTGKQSRFSGLFNQSISDSSNSKESTAMSEQGQQCQSSALRQVADIS